MAVLSDSASATTSSLYQDEPPTFYRLIKSAPVFSHRVYRHAAFEQWTI